MAIIQMFNKPGLARRMSTPIHTHSTFTTLIYIFLPPVALQKGERDTQVQFRGRRKAGKSEKYFDANKN
ncbi:hypothetical protein T01_8401 [Trichinella spiralis]|uniref:Uncharacterized protein n=1 Tax=Trichinella spiralis TaxID=6334 RepID=A0A0V1BU28_TRISP|nr:hypothetical protein T01_8401 [Trichinella spiralis]